MYVFSVCGCGSTHHVYFPDRKKGKTMLVFFFVVCLFD